MAEDAEGQGDRGIGIVDDATMRTAQQTCWGKGKMHNSKMERLIFE
jgi:hypothetical protein